MSENRLQKSEQIYQMLRRKIILLEMAPGSALLEKEVAAEAGVSRTPVREAIQKLADEGLVTIFPHSGTIVSKISFQMASEGFVIRRALEVESARRAALRSDERIQGSLTQMVAEMRVVVGNNQLDRYIDVDDAFHHAIAEASGINLLWRFIRMAKVDLDRMRQLSAPVPGHLERVTEQHVQIAEAIIRGKPEQAELAMRIHLESSFEVMSALMSGGDEFFFREATE